MRPIDADVLTQEYIELQYSDQTMGIACNRYMSEIARVAKQPTINLDDLIPHGYWIHCKGKSNLWYCSWCGEKINYNQKRRTYNIKKKDVHEVHKHCRSCGAKMDFLDICSGDPKRGKV